MRLSGVAFVVLGMTAECFFSLLSAQVIIRERVTIDPKLPAQVQSSNGGGSVLRFELNYDGPVRTPELNFMRMDELFCGVHETAPLNSSISVPAQSGLWNFSFRIHTPIVSNQFARFTVWLGNDKILADSLLINCGSTCQINHQFGFRISNTFNFSANGQVVYGDQSTLNAAPSGQQHCMTQMWHPGLPVNLTIVSGGELGQFADLDGNPLGDAISVAGHEVDNVTFLADGMEPDSISDFVTIEASSFGITRTTTIEVLRISDSPIWLAMDAQGDVSYGAQMSVIAQALDMFQSEVSAGTGVTYSFEIIEGSEWGSLRRLSVEGNVITGVRPTNDFFSRGRGFVEFLARKSDPLEPQRVTVRVTASNPEIRPGTYSFNVIPSPLAITATPPTIRYGERSVILVQKKNPDGTVTPWPPNAHMSFEIINGNNAGYLQFPDTSLRNDQISGQFSSIQFAALEESAQPDSVEVKFYVYVFDEGTATPPATASSSASISGFDPILPNPALRRTGLITVKVTKQTNLTLLLGESKYYYVVEEGGGLKVKDDGDPNNPFESRIQDVTFSVESVDGDTSGVYWENQHPVYSGATFAGVADLPQGFLRMVGRYSLNERTYKARLVARKNDDITSAVIAVEKPRELGDSQFARNRSSTLDVYNAHLDIDSLCIHYGGRFGIPPQLIKGHIEQESAFIGSGGVGFAPSYRYEPYTVQFWDRVRNRTQNPFFVTEGNIRHPPPPQHSHVQFIPYFTQQVSVWQVIVDHSELLETGGPDHRLYGRQVADTMDFRPYSRMQQRYSAFLKLAKRKHPKAFADSANAQMARYLRYDWRPVKNSSVGGENIIAQTRLASSYGWLQMLYTTALERRYPEDGTRLPEILNVTDTCMTYSLRYQKSLLVTNLGAPLERGNDWPGGYENAFYLYVLPAWNSIATYPASVMRRAQGYLPKK
ncbi:MAG: hypothetical protein WEB37_05345 [Bacteroidota bacterium]